MPFISTPKKVLTVGVLEPRKRIFLSFAFFSATDCVAFNVKKNKTNFLVRVVFEKNRAKACQYDFRISFTEYTITRAIGRLFFRNGWRPLRTYKRRKRSSNFFGVRIYGILYKPGQKPVCRYWLSVPVLKKPVCRYRLSFLS